MKAALPWAFSPSLTAMQLLGHAGPPEEPVATDAVITVKNARKSDGDALSMGFFVL